MFNYLEVDGYRSLVKFKLELKSGLNLLIGPNGSGKSNIISFLGFVCESSLSGLSQAVGNQGGSGTVFRKHGEKKYHSQIKSKIRGCVEPALDDLPEEKKETHKNIGKLLHYEYSFTIELSADRESVFFAAQTLRLHVSDKNIRTKTIKVWGLDISIVGTADGAVRCVHASASSIFEEELKGLLGRKDETLSEFIEARVNAETSIITTCYILLSRSFGLPFFMDFQKSIVFNPHPSQIRLPEDSAKSPGIYPDGSGLYASLLALKRSRTKTSKRIGFIFRPNAVPFNPRIKLDRLTEFFRLAYPTMTKLSVTNDQFENTIRVRVTLEGTDEPQIPLAALSDGTLKWMSLVTAIFTNDSIVAIEEPENFIHPSIQREAVKIARDQTQDHSLLLMSSHSETILNSAEPEEVVVVSIINGCTYARRVKDPQKLRQLINESGFGLGFHYLSGGLEDA